MLTMELTSEKKEKDKQHERTVDDFVKENKLLRIKLTKVSEQLTQSQKKLTEDKKLQKLKINELGIKLLEFEDSLKKDQRRLKALLKSKDQQLRKKDSIIDSLECEIREFKEKLRNPCVDSSKPSLGGSDYHTKGNNVERNTPKESPTKLQDLSHLLYLDLNTDQHSGRRFFRRHILSPVAEVREDLDDYLLSPGKSSPKTHLGPDICMPKAISDLFSFEVKQGASDKIVADEDKVETSVTENSNEQGFQLPSNESHPKNTEELSPNSLLLACADMPDIGIITDQDSDDVKNAMSSHESDVLTDAILNSSFEDRMLNIASEDNTAHRISTSPTENNVAHLIKAQKDIRNSLVYDSDGRDEFFDCPLATVENHTENDQFKNNVDGTVCELQSMKPDTDLPRSEHAKKLHDHITDDTEYKNEGSDTLDVNKNPPQEKDICSREDLEAHTQVNLLKNANSDLDSSGSLKEEWSDAPDNQLSVHDAEENQDKISNLCEDLPINQNYSDNHSLKKPCLSEHSNGQLASNVYIGDEHNKKDITTSPGDGTLEEYDVIDIDLDARL